MNSIPQDGSADQGASSPLYARSWQQSQFGFSPRMEELAELYWKREVLRKLYSELRRDKDDINICLLLKDIERAATILDRRITICTNCLILGVHS